MKTKITLAITGESLINRRISVYTDDRFLALIKLLRGADAAFTHFESIIHDYDGPEVYPAAESAGIWQRSPRYVADELKWAGFHLISTAHNHVLDYSYGGLFSTLEAMDEAGLVHAGTGRNLGEAREPAYLDTAKGRVALISMTSSGFGWSRAGDARRDVKGRPGLNPLRLNYVADIKTLETLKEMAFRMGWEVWKVGKTWMFNPPGNQMAFIRFAEGDKPGISVVPDEDDVEANLRSVRDASRQADYVLVHLHSHESHPDKGTDVPADYVPAFAKACLDAGAHVFIGEGREPPKGIEIYKGKPIFYGPGGLIMMSFTITKLPADYYMRPGYPPEIRSWEATPADGYDAREPYPKQLSPPGRPPSSPWEGSVVALCSLGEDAKLTELRLHPITVSRRPRSRSGLPMLADGQTAERIIAHVAALSAPFGAKIEYNDGAGSVRL
ncbi:MAG: CapA family protein [Chloroflexi bacterium]|nr:CapA family protein [Chloroflexota bacterium]